MILEENDSIDLYHIFNDINDQKNMLYITQRKKVYAIGNNANGILGVGHNEPVRVAQELKLFRETAVNGFVITPNFVLAFGEFKVFSWGNNEFGQLGRNDQHEIPSKVEIPFPKRINQISQCNSTVMAVLAFGVQEPTVWVWGRNDGQKFKGMPDIIGKPEELTTAKDKTIEIIRLYEQCFFMICNNKTVYSCGNNDQGQLGHGRDIKHVDSPDIIGDISSLSYICEVTSDGSNSYALFKDGDIKVFGKLTDGEFHSLTLDKEMRAKELEIMPNNQVVALVEKNNQNVVYEIKGRNLSKTYWTSFAEYSVNVCKISHRTYRVKDNLDLFEYVKSMLNNS